MSDDRPWLSNLPFGLPPNFDYSVVRNADEAQRMMFALPNSDRGTAAVGLYECRDMIGDDVVYHGMMAAWDHDAHHVVNAFGSHYDFGLCLSDVAPLNKLSKPVRVWRGVQMRPDSHPAEAAFGISWTRNRHVACWFALRFPMPEWRPFVFQVSLAPGAIIALHHDRGEREAIVNLEDLECYSNSIVVDGSSIGLDDLKRDSRAPEHLVARWRRARARHQSVMDQGRAKRLGRLTGKGEQA